MREFTALVVQRFVKNVMGHKLTRIGADTDIQVDVRVIAATNKNLKEEIVRGNFREDLYHRLSVILINVPPLKERREDIGELTRYFIESICNEMRIAPKFIEEEAIQKLESGEWSGNIRELRNVVERLIILGGPAITLRDVELYL